MAKNVVTTPPADTGYWTVLYRAQNRRPGEASWFCRCACGLEKVVPHDSLRRGASRSCGCKGEEARNKARTKHGMHASRTYQIWEGMKRRCLNPTSGAFHLYGGRGIQVCERWMEFKNFLHDMGEVPAGLQIDRIDPNGDYEPSNCRWATDDEQRFNKRNSRLLTFQGQTKPLLHWCADLGLEPNTVWRRVRKSGWSVERALMTPGKSK